jgi:hypothetical protein
LRWLGALRRALALALRKIWVLRGVVPNSVHPTRGSSGTRPLRVSGSPAGEPLLFAAFE